MYSTLKFEPANASGEVVRISLSVDTNSGKGKFQVQCPLPSATNIKGATCVLKNTQDICKNNPVKSIEPNLRQKASFSRTKKLVELVNSRSEREVRLISGIGIRKM